MKYGSKKSKIIFDRLIGRIHVLFSIFSMSEEKNIKISVKATNIFF